MARGKSGSWILGFYGFFWILLDALDLLISFWIPGPQRIRSPPPPRMMHRVLLEYEVKEGELIHWKGGRKFPFSKRISNELLQETEIFLTILLFNILFLIR